MTEQVLSELQLLTAMYDPVDIRFHDPQVLTLVENCIPISDSVSFSVRLNDMLELDMRIPLGYPDTERLSAHCRVSAKNPGVVLDRVMVREWESKINAELSRKKGDEGEEINLDVLGVIQFCNEHFDKHPPPSEQNSTSSKTSSKQESDQCRIWIYSHHIYNKNKRKFLVSTADDLDLSGFSLPGKPGFICVEGDPDQCDEYWSRVRQLTWQKISLIERQLVPKTDIIFDRKRFEELHCDKSAFIKFLEERNSSSVIKDYLGLSS